MGIRKLRDVVFPQWSYFPRNEAPPEWVEPTIGAVAEVQADISTAVIRPTAVSSDDVLRAIAPALVRCDWVVETGKRAGEKIERPVLYGDNGEVKVKYEIDGWHPRYQVALEVEAGRGAANNADYRDIVRASLLLDARFLCLAMPVEYRSGASRWHAYAKTNAQLDAIYASQRLRLPFDGVLLIGY